MLQTHLIRFVAALLAITVAAYGPLLAEATPQAKRWAIVVGNDLYKNLAEHHQLKKAVSDSRAIAQTFRDLKYDEVLTGENLGRSEFYALWQKLLDKSGPEDTVSIYFSGHGIEIDGRNYLIPSDFPPAVYGREERAKRESISVSDLMLDLKGKKPKAQLVLMILDACRDHPLVPPGQKGTNDSGGLANMDPPSGTFIMYAAGAGQTALDRLPGSDPDANSVYTRKLLPLLKTKGLTIAELAQRVRRDVYELAAKVPHQQVPAYYDGVLNLFCVAGCEEEAAATAPQQTTPPPTAPSLPPTQTPVAASPSMEPLSSQPTTDSPKTAAADTATAAAPSEPPKPATAQPAPSQTAMLADPLLPPPDPKVLTRSIQEHLKRLGCFDVEPTGTWGPKTTAAAHRFNADVKDAAKTIATTGPSPEATKTLSMLNTRVCAERQPEEAGQHPDCDSFETLETKSWDPPVAIPRTLDFVWMRPEEKSLMRNRADYAPDGHLITDLLLLKLEKTGKALYEPRNFWPSRTKFEEFLFSAESSLIHCAQRRFRIAVTYHIDDFPGMFSNEVRGKAGVRLDFLGWFASKPVDNGEFLHKYGWSTVSRKAFDFSMTCEYLFETTEGDQRYKCSAAVDEVERIAEDLFRMLDTEMRQHLEKVQ